MRRIVFEMLILASIFYICNLIIKKNDKENYISTVSVSIILLDALENNKMQKVKLIFSSDILGIYQMIQNDKDMEKYKNLCQYIQDNKMPFIKDLHKNLSTPKIKNELNEVFTIAKQGREKLKKFCKLELSKQKAKK